MIREREGWGQGAFVSVMETSACKRLLSDEIFAELCGSAVSAAAPLKPPCVPVKEALGGLCSALRAPHTASLAR